MNACEDLVSGRTIFNLLVVLRAGMCQFSKNPCDNRILRNLFRPQIAPKKSAARKAESKTSTRHSRVHHAACPEHAPHCTLSARHDSSKSQRHPVRPQTRHLREHHTARSEHTPSSLHAPRHDTRSLHVTARSLTLLHGTARHSMSLHGCTVLAWHI